MSALVFNCSYNGLSIIRDLGREGIPVLALDTHRTVGTFSRYARFKRCPDPQVAEREFVDFLMKLGPYQKDRPVLLPTNDQWALAVARHRDQLEHFYRPCVADAATVELLVEKQRFYDWCQIRGYPVPRSWRATAHAEVPDSAFPLAAKPESRRVAGDDSEAEKRATVLDQMRLRVLESRRELEQFVSQLGDLCDYYILQEYVRGMADCMVTVGVYADRQYRVRALFSGRKLRGVPPDIGDCSFGQVERVPEEIRILVQRLCVELRYHGIAEFEFKRDAVTGRYWLIEINPRTWSWVGITAACGVGLPSIAYHDLMGDNVRDYVESDAEDGSVKWVRVSADLPAALWENRARGFAGNRLTFREWRASLCAEKLVFAEWARDDWTPAIVAVLSVAARLPAIVWRHLWRKSFW